MMRNDILDEETTEKYETNWKFNLSWMKNDVDFYDYLPILKVECNLAENTTILRAFDRLQ